MRFTRCSGQRILLRVRSSRCPRKGALIVFAERVRTAFLNPIPCTLRVPRGRCSVLGGRVLARSGCGCGDLRTRGRGGSRGCVQREMGRLTGLRHLHTLLSTTRAARAVMQQVVARACVREAGD